MEKETLRYYLPCGLSPADVERARPALEYQLNAKVEIETRGKVVLLHVYRGGLPRLVTELDFDVNDYKLPVVIGQSYKGPMVLDLNDSHWSLLVAGYPGTGKSNFLNQALAQITEQYTPERVELWLVDLKLGIEFKRWQKNTKHCKRYAWDPEGPALSILLRKLSAEIRRRMEVFEETGVGKIDDYNRMASEPLPYMLLVVDEYAEIKRMDKEIETQIQSIMQIGRAAGLRCIISTQRPSVDNIGGSIKGLISDRLAFRCANRTSSEVAIDQGGAELLPVIPGRGLFLSGSQVLEVQTPLFSDAPP